MQQEPLDYDAQATTRTSRVRRVFVRVIIAAWAFVPCAFVFAVLSSSDQNPMQIPAMVVFLASPFVAAAITLVYWLHWR